MAGDRNLAMAVIGLILMSVFWLASERQSFGETVSSYAIAHRRIR